MGEESPGPQTGGFSGPLPPQKFLKACLIVWYNTKLHSFLPQKIADGCGPAKVQEPDLRPWGGPGA